MSRICLRHELSMLGLSVAGLRKGDRGFRTREHARVLRDIEHCDRCRARKPPAAPGEVDRTVYKAIPDPVDEPVTAKASDREARPTRHR